MLQKKRRHVEAARSHVFHIYELGRNVPMFSLRTYLSCLIAPSMLIIIASVDFFDILRQKV